MTASSLTATTEAPQPESANPKVEIGPSAIHGLGLFAAQPIRKGEVIGLYEGHPATEDGDHVLWIFDENTGEE